MTKILLQVAITSLYLFVQLQVNGQFNKEWGITIGGAGLDVSTAITTDKWGNVITAGYFSGSVDFDPSAGTQLLNAASGNYFILKLDSAGKLIWVKQLNLGMVISALITYDKRYPIASLVTDSAGNIIVGGYWTNYTTDFDPGPGTENRTASGRDAFILKLNPNGEYVWVKQFGGINSPFCKINGLAVDNQNNIYSCGQFQGTADFDPFTANNWNLTAQGGDDVFVNKLNPEGDVVWVRSMGGNSNDVAYAVVVDAAQNVYTTGTFKGTADFDPGAGSHNLHTALSGEFGTTFISKLDYSGAFVWAHSLDVTSSSPNDMSLGNAIGLDATNNVYVAGEFRGAVDFDPSASGFTIISNNMDAFVCKLDQGGQFKWASKIGGDANNNDYISSIGLDSASNIYLAGLFTETADFDPGPSTYTLTKTSSQILDYADLFLCMWDSSGNFKSAIKFDAAYPQPTAVALDPYGCIYTSGKFQHTVNLNASGSGAPQTSKGGYDFFISKLSLPVCNPNLVRLTTYDTACVTYLSPSAKYHWNKTGTYMDTISTKSGGCDSAIITVNLTIHDATSSHIQVNACNK